jgi:hypothetical protein
MGATENQSTIAGDGAPEQGGIPGIALQNSPAMAVFAGRLYMAHRAAGSDQLMYTTFDGNAWSTSAPIEGCSSSATPALAVYRGKLYLAHKGATGDNKIWCATFDGIAWSAHQIITAASTPAAPTLAVLKGKLYLACKGAGDGSGIWYATFDGTKWSAAQTIRDAQTSAEPMLAAYSGTLYLAYKGQDDDGAMWYQTCDGTSWSARQSIPGVNTSSAPALVTFDKQLLLAYWEQSTGLLQIATKDDSEWHLSNGAIDSFSGMVGSAGLAVFRNKLYCAANVGNAMAYLSRSSSYVQPNIKGFVTSYTFGSVDDPLAIGVEMTDAAGIAYSGSIVGQTETSSTGFTVVLTLAMENGYEVALLDSSTDSGMFDGVQLFAPTLPELDSSPTG